MKQTLLRYCGVITVVLLIGAGLLYCFGRSLTIERGVRLRAHNAKGFVYDAWSYGAWQSSRDGYVHVCTFSPPYKLLIAIRPGDYACDSVEMVSATIMTKGGKRIDIGPLVQDRVERVERRHSAIIDEPYAVFCFQDALPTHETFGIEIAFRTLPDEQSDEQRKVHRQELTIEGFEIRTHSLVFWERIKGV